jgi:DNA-binding CsgD family transcriptional regulator/tetratricopeptide (TPR) repeat protein
VLILGDEGAGKSRLMEELGRLRSEHTRVAFARCYQQAASIPFAAVRQLGRELVLGRPAATLTLDTTPARHEGPEAAAASRYARIAALAEVIEQMTDERPLLLAVDDIHWADTATLLLANFLLEGHSRVQLLCTAGETWPAEGERSRLLRELRAKLEIVRIGPLQDDEAAQLLHGLLGRVRLSETETSYVNKLAGGNALLLTELAHQLARTSAVEDLPVEEALAVSGLPARLTTLVDQRMAGLTRTQAIVLESLAVLQQSASPEILAHLARVSVHEAESALESSARSGLVAERSGRFDFASPLYGRSVAGGIEPGRRRALHLGIAAAAEAGLIALTASEVAVHSIVGAPEGDEAAARSACKAAQECEDAGAYRQAARFWKAALRRCPAEETPRRARLLSRLAASTWFAGDGGAACARFEETFALYSALSDDVAAAEAAFAIGDIKRSRLELREARSWLEKSLAHAPEGSVIRARGLALLGSVDCGLGLMDSGLRHLVEAGDACGDCDSAPEIAYWTMYGLALAGDHAGAVRAGRRGYQAAMRAGQGRLVSLLGCLLVQESLSYLEGEAAVEILGEMAPTAAPRDPPVLSAELVANCFVRGYEGNWQEAADLCRRWVSEVRLAGRFQVATARMLWGEALSAMGDLQSALELVREALPDIGSMRGAALAHYSRMLARAGDTSAAADAACEAAGLLIASRRSIGARALLLELACQFRDGPLAQRLHASLEAVTSPVAMIYAPVSVTRARSRFAALTGDWVTAFALIDEAVVGLKSGGAHWELAVTHRAAAELRSARGRKGDTLRAEAHAAEARQIFEALGSGCDALPLAGAGDLPQAARRYGLSPREIEVLQLVARGHRNQEIADSLALSVYTVARHLENIFAKMAVSSRTQAVVEAARAGLILPVS